MMPVRLRLFATTPLGMERLLAEELEGLGAASVRPVKAGVAFSGSLEDAYRACLWSRLASRVLLRLTEVRAEDADTLYASVHGIPWEDHLGPEGTLAVDFVGSSPAIRHTRFGALRVKDAIVDRFRERCGVRPSVDTRRPDLRVHARLRGGGLTLSVDLSGEPLHRRGYRVRGVEAPLKENLAAAILMRAGWPALAGSGRPLVDPMCGSGTLVLEAAMMGGDCAPGLSREYFGFFGWRGHDRALWERLCEEARQRRAAGTAAIPHIRGFDADGAAVEAARANAAAAGLIEKVRLERRDVADCGPGDAGLLVVNPPYGERLGDRGELAGLYRRLADAVERCYGGWDIAVFTADSDFRERSGMPARRSGVFFNGRIRCELLTFRPRGGGPRREAAVDPGREMFANRLRKNLRQLSRWARREGVHCYRLYDADMPEYAAAVDIYQGPERWAHIQEYAPPRDVDPQAAAARRESVRAVVPEVIEIPADHMFYKVRQRQRGTGQYGKLAEEGVFHEVWEGDARLLVNFTDYLDTGLFLDHRPTRFMLRRLAAGRRFLNLFGYTGAASVHAALAGARTTTVDMSATYLDWARRNFALNGLDGEQHRFVRADCLEWLADQRDERFDVIFMDPPTFSNSKRMERPFDVLRDHVTIIRQASELLSAEGVLIFSNNARSFRMEADALPELAVEDITRETLPRDFQRNRKIHNCWRITRRSG